MIAPENLRSARVRMYGDNVLKIGYFGVNCSSGRYVTKVPERWSASWDDCLRLAKMMDEAGFDFILPIGRWKGYGGETDYQGASWETITWATGLLAATKRITVFGTVHAALFHPLIAAKQIVTADHAGHGRFGLNIVCGWNEGEFEMFGVSSGDHASRYRIGQEWIDVLRLAWTRDDFDYSGEFYHLKGVREKPKPYGGTLPLIMNAGHSSEGRAFGLRNCDAWFTTVRVGSGHIADLETASRVVQDAKAEGRRAGHDIDVYTVGIVACKPTRKEAEEFNHYVAIEQADLGAIDNMLAWRGVVPTSPEDRDKLRRQQGSGGGVRLIGTPDDVAETLAAVSRAGFAGIGISFLNYADELPYFRDEVLSRLERMGLRTPR
jgi:alkanesulfonate monooxygenase SsuD/methylene tetrahydromethanopterin reductase-like flavin-dependent oxidoreductase (luciferase family)